MKKFYVLALSALMVAAFAVPSFAKVNLSGAMWVTYWAQEEGTNSVQSGNGTAWGDLNANIATTPYTAGLGTAAAASKKTFLVGQAMSGNGVTAKATQGYGFELVADCPVNDWVKAYGDFNVVNAGNLGLVEGYINLAFMKEFNVRAGRMQVPFGYERTQRPVAGQDEVFVSEYSQDASGALLRTYDVGVQAFGTVASGLVDYSLFIGNGAINTVADSNGLLGASAAVNANANNVTPDNNDAKQYGLNVCFKPFTGATVGGAYFAGDYTQPLVAAGNRARFSAYDFNAAYEYGNIFAVSGEYATTRHDKMSGDFPYYTTASTGTLVQNRVNEFILKAIYTGVADWEFGVRYGAVDPKNVEAEVAAGYSYERKVSFAAGYHFARAAFLKAEYSWVDNDFAFTDKAAPVAARIRQNPTQDVDDDIFALSLGLQF